MRDFFFLMFLTKNKPESYKIAALQIKDPRTHNVTEERLIKVYVRNLGCFIYCGV